MNRRMTDFQAGLIGASIIVGSLTIAGVLKPQLESYPNSLQALCETHMLAAVAVQENGIHCPGEATFGHSEGSLALCGMARGRTPEQIARLPQCQGVFRANP